MEFGWKTMKFPFQTWFWINRRLLFIEMPFSYIKLFNWENIGYVVYPPEALFWSLKEGKYIHCSWMTSFVYLRNLATSDIPISGFPGCHMALLKLAKTSNPYLGTIICMVMGWGSEWFPRYCHVNWRGGAYLEGSPVSTIECVLS